MVKLCRLKTLKMRDRIFISVCHYCNDIMIDKAYCDKVFCRDNPLVWTGWRFSEKDAKDYLKDRKGNEHEQ